MPHDYAKRWPYPRVMAHRCGGALAPENTLAGLKISAQLGCRGVEFDVMLSADGTPLLIHDETLERTTNGHGEVCATADRTLFELDAGAKHHKAFSGERVPRFEETVECCRTLGLMANVEIKPAAGFEKETGSAAAHSASQGWAGEAVLPILSSFSEPALAAAQSIAPHLPRGLLFDRLSDDWLVRCRRLDVCAVHTNGRYLTQELAEEIKATGLRLVVYTENDPVRAWMLFGWGVDSVITDRPDIVHAPHWPLS